MVYVFSRQLNLRSPSSLAQIREWRGGKDSHMKQTDQHTAGSMVLQRNKMFPLRPNSLKYQTLFIIWVGQFRVFNVI